MTAPSPFPQGFLWGAATSAYQIEGHPLDDGAGPSIWHRFAHTPGRVARSETGDLACEHYRRHEEDIAIMADLGLNAYRFSIAWGRVMPAGRGRVNSKGLDFYQRLVDGLLERGIQPMVTLYHWDLPADLQDRGGWLSPDSPRWLADYAEVVFKAMDDRVTRWVTINEPWVITVLGHLEGVHAPGHRDLFETPRVMHHLLLAHAEAADVYRALGKHRIGIALNLEPQHPASTSKDDRAATERRDIFVNRWLLDPLLLGRYPQGLDRIFGAAWPDFPPEDLEHLPGSIDFLGVNYYSRRVVSAVPERPPVHAACVHQADAAHTAMGWEVYPQGLLETLLRLQGYASCPPLYITENGAAFADPQPHEGVIQDPERLAYLREHIAAAGEARAQGVDLRGYFAWSLLDNFEWAEGYDKRFGLYGVDRRTLERIPKASARFYRSLIRSELGPSTG